MIAFLLFTYVCYIIDVFHISKPKSTSPFKILHIIYHYMSLPIFIWANTPTLKFQADLYFSKLLLKNNRTNTFCWVSFERVCFFFFFLEKVLRIKINMSICICRGSLARNELFTEMYTLFRSHKVNPFHLCVPVKQGNIPERGEMGVEQNSSWPL